MKRIYQKEHNRYLPIVAIEFWYRAQGIIFPLITNKNIFFKPLFIHRNERAVDIYYTDLEKKHKLLWNFFEKDPRLFKEFAEDSMAKSKRLLNFCKNANVNDIPELCRIISDEIWPIVSISYIFGRDSKIKSIKNMAISLRKKTELLVYEGEWALYNLKKKKFSQQTGLEQYLDYLTVQETISGKLPSFSELEKRKEGFIYFEGKLYVGKSVDGFLKENNIELTDDSEGRNGGVIKGSIACKGKVTGRVKLVFEINQSRELKKGEILVSPMTVPDFLSAMDKAAAFVTDEGGLTCHAAIVARELGKPCIIGTKIATKVLKNGDLVEVDANNGFVKKLTKEEYEKKKRI